MCIVPGINKSWSPFYKDIKCAICTLLFAAVNIKFEADVCVNMAWVFLWITQVAFSIASLKYVLNMS